MKPMNRLLLLSALILVNVSAKAQNGTVYAWRNFAGQPGGAGVLDGPCSGARFNLPCGIGADSAGNLYVAERGNGTIRKISGGLVTALAGLAGASGSADGTNAAARFNNLAGAAVDGAGNVYVADEGNH